MATSLVISRPRLRDIPVLMDIEQDASRLFASTAHASEIGADGLPESRFKAAIDQYLVWMVNVNDVGTVGFGLVLWLEGGVHLHEISVRLEWTGKGIGSHLLEHICSELTARGHCSLTLSTFSDVPWNAPFYARRGFRPIAEDDLSPALRAIRRSEQRAGLDSEMRVFMRRALSEG